MYAYNFLSTAVALQDCGLLTVEAYFRSQLKKKSQPFSFRKTWNGGLDVAYNVKKLTLDFPC